MKLTITKQRVFPQPRTLKSNWTILPTEFMATTPRQYIDNWAMSDKDPSETLQKLNERMQNRWPGKYTIVQKEVHDPRYAYKVIKYDFQFDSPKDETWFNLQYPR